MNPSFPLEVSENMFFSEISEETKFHIDVYKEPKLLEEISIDTKFPFKIP